MKYDVWIQILLLYHLQLSVRWGSKIIWFNKSWINGKVWGNSAPDFETSDESGAKIASRLGGTIFNDLLCGKVNASFENCHLRLYWAWLVQEKNVFLQLGQLLSSHTQTFCGSASYPFSKSLPPPSLWCGKVHTLGILFFKNVTWMTLKFTKVIKKRSHYPAAHSLRTTFTFRTTVQNSFWSRNGCNRVGLPFDGGVILVNEVSGQFLKLIFALDLFRFVGVKVGHHNGAIAHGLRAHWQL